jgi:hypothetical protein
MANLQRYADVLAQNHFSNLLSKVTFLQKEGLNAAQIDHIKDLALFHLQVP